tara:strand:- start:295 stop:411 length:117 start_codon:yes stop_codon:yes gene_type:complete
MSVIHNEIFEYFRVQEKKIEEAKKLLEQNGYITHKVNS